MNTSPPTLEKKTFTNFTFGRLMRTRHGSLEETSGQQSTDALFQNLTLNPRRSTSLTLFLRRDSAFTRQRRLLYELQIQRGKTPFLPLHPAKRRIRDLPSFKANIDPKLKKEINTMYDLPRKRSASTLDKVSTMLKLKKIIKRTFAEHLHLLKVAIRDRNANLALYYASKISQNGLKRKETAAINRVFLMAMCNGMSNMVLHFIEKGHPKDFNAPAFEMVLERTAEKTMKSALESVYFTPDPSGTLYPSKSAELFFDS